MRPHTSLAEDIDALIKKASLNKQDSPVKKPQDSLLTKVAAALRNVKNSPLTFDELNAVKEKLYG